MSTTRTVFPDFCPPVLFVDGAMEEERWQTIVEFLYDYEGWSGLCLRRGGGAVVFDWGDGNPLAYSQPTEIPLLMRITWLPTNDTRAQYIRLTSIETYTEVYGEEQVPWNTPLSLKWRKVPWVAIRLAKRTTPI